MDLFLFLYKTEVFLVSAFSEAHVRKRGKGRKEGGRKGKIESTKKQFNIILDIFSVSEEAYGVAAALTALKRDIT